MVGKSTFGVGTLAFGKSGSTFHFVISNKVRESQWLALQPHCAHLATLNRQELRQLKMELWEQPRHDDLKGGNIGLIEVILKAHNPVEFHFSQPTPFAYQFTVSARIS
jgi:hypothetical protein